MTILDSNIWIGYLDTNDSLHARAAVVCAGTERPFILPEYVLVEIITIITYKRGKQAADNFIKSIDNNEAIELLPSDPEFLKEILKFFCESVTSKLSLTDTALLYLSQTYTVLTFDKQLARAIKLSQSEIHSRGKIKK